VGLADVKLHGAQTGFLRCVDEFPAWKGELHGTQTHRNIQETTTLIWKKVKLHGSQTIQFHLYVTHSIWRGVKLQGTQTSKKSKSRCFVRKQNYMVLKSYSR